MSEVKKNQILTIQLHFMHLCTQKQSLLFDLKAAHTFGHALNPDIDRIGPNLQTVTWFETGRSLLLEQGAF